MKTSLFETAPEDILRFVFKASSKDDLVRLSMVNKRFKALLEPQIYHTIDWVWEKNSIPPITSLLRTILARPGLATYIRNVELTSETFHLPSFRMKLPPKIPVPRTEIDQIIAVVEESEVTSSGLWIEMLGGGTELISIDISPQGQPTRLATMDAVLAILLS